MIKAISSSICKGITGCQVEMNGTGGELLKEYRGIVVSMLGSLCQHMPTEMAKEVLKKITTEAIKQAEEKVLQRVSVLWSKFRPWRSM